MAKKKEKEKGNVKNQIDKLREQLKASRQRYKDLYENARVALYRTRISDGKVLECNNMLIRLFGYDNKTEFLKERGYAARDYDSDRRRELLALLERYGEVNGFEVKTFRKDGSELWIKIFARVYPHEGYIEGAIIDVTPNRVLSSAEKRVFKLIMEGKSNQEIADELHRSIRTIEDHRAHIMRKLRVHNTVELVKRGYGIY